MQAPGLLEKVGGRLRGQGKDLGADLKIDTRNLADNLNTGPPHENFLLIKIKCAEDTTSKKILKDFSVKLRLSLFSKTSQSKGGSYVQKN
jgi:hypothetical protein